MTGDVISGAGMLDTLRARGFEPSGRAYGFDEMRVVRARVVTGTKSWYSSKGGTSFSQVNTRCCSSKDAQPGIVPVEKSSFRVAGAVGMARDKSGYVYGIFGADVWSRECKSGVDEACC